MIKQFISLIRRFIPPYRKFLFGNLALNLLAQILNVFSFAQLIPILQIPRLPMPTTSSWRVSRATTCKVCSEGPLLI
jgi:hypothetical protein